MCSNSLLRKLHYAGEDGSILHAFLGEVSGMGVCAEGFEGQVCGDGSEGVVGDVLFDGIGHVVGLEVISVDLNVFAKIRGCCEIAEEAVANTVLISSFETEVVLFKCSGLSWVGADCTLTCFRRVNKLEVKAEDYQGQGTA